MHKWIKPATGSYKLNVDADVPLNDSCFSVGMVIRDCTGAFIQGKVLKFPCNISVFEAETRGVWEALGWIDTLGLCCIQVETDSLSTVTAIEKVEVNYLELGNFIEECKV